MSPTRLARTRSKRERDGCRCGPAVPIWPMRSGSTPTVSGSTGRSYSSTASGRVRCGDNCRRRRLRNAGRRGEAAGIAVSSLMAKRGTQSTEPRRISVLWWRQGIREPSHRRNQSSEIFAKFAPPWSDPTVRCSRSNSSKTRLEPTQQIVE